MLGALRPEDAELRRAHLHGSSLRRARLAEADLRGAGLFGADLSKAELVGARLCCAGLTYAVLRGAWTTPDVLDELSLQLEGSTARAWWTPTCRGRTWGAPSSLRPT